MRQGLCTFFFEILPFVVILHGGHMVESFACASCVCVMAQCVMTHTVSWLL